MGLITGSDYIHKFVPAHSDSSPPITLLLLHGTGGDENSLLSLGHELWPGAALLGLRGKVLENGMPPSFRRFTESDFGNVRARTEELAQFIRTSSEHYGFSTRRLIVVGVSNGANLAASLILFHPHYLAGAVLFRVVLLLSPDIIRDFGHLSVFIGGASSDPLIPRGQAYELAAILESGGATVAISSHSGGRELGQDDVRAATDWLARESFRKKLAA